MSYPRTPTTTTSAATTTPNATPNEPYDASPATPTDSATPSASTPSKPHNSPKRCFSHRYFRRRQILPADQRAIATLDLHCPKAADLSASAPLCVLEDRPDI